MARCHVDGCTGRVVAQWQRHATDAEFAAIPEKIRPIDGVATVAVHGCETHELLPFCRHDGADPAACPTCGATDAPCTDDQGAPRHRNHAARPAPAPPQPCRHHHRADCPGHGGCACTDADEPPARPRYTPPPQPGTAKIQAELGRRADAERAYWADLVARYGGDKQTARQAVRDDYVARVIGATPPPGG